MKSIAFVTDSNCGMSPAQARELGVHMLPMPFFIDDKEYLEDIDIGYRARINGYGNGKEVLFFRTRVEKKIV